MKFLITGGAGFIGGHLTEALIKEGHSVSIIDDLSTGSLENLASVQKHPNLEVIVDDIITCPELNMLVYKCDCIFHLAAAVGVELVVNNPAQTIVTNVHGTERVLTLASKFSKRCIVASTSEVYGKSSKEKFTETDDLIIGPPSNSRWSYACSKLIDEFLVMAYYRDRKFPGTVVRFFNTVGPRQTGRYGMVLPRFAESAIAGKNLRVYGTGTQTRCFCHVADVVRALLLVAGNTESYGKIFNIGSSRKVTIKELAEMVIKRAGSKSGIDTIPYSEAYEAGFEDMLHRAPNCDAVKELTGWEPSISLEQIIDDVIESVKGRRKA